MSEKYTFLFAPADAVGHFNACIGIAEQLRDRGHTVVFTTPYSRKGQLKAQGFVEEYYAPSPEGEESSIKKNDNKWGEILAKMAPQLALDNLGKSLHLYPALHQEIMAQIKYSNPQYPRIMEKVKPDVVIVDNIAESPALVDVGTPWVFLPSISPLCVSSKNVPPPYSGLPTDSDRALWKSYYEKEKEVLYPVYLEFKTWLAENGGPNDLKYFPPLFHRYSPYANIYMYPKELDYTSLRPVPPNWYGFDALVRLSGGEPFEIPKTLDGKPGKLIYFSMGTIGCAELGMMRRLVAILAKSPNRFIVSKGPLADQFELADNMWGEANVPQTKVLPLVDLVITHGGNNSITESFYFGKRVLVLPLFVDQIDNGQRVFETGLGLNFHPYHVSESELLGAIEALLKDDMLERRMATIGQRIRSTNCQAGAADVIEAVARKQRAKDTAHHKG